MARSLAAFHLFKRELLAIVAILLTGLVSLQSFPLRIAAIDGLLRAQTVLFPRPVADTYGSCILFLDVSAVGDSKPYFAIIQRLRQLHARAVVFDIVFDKDFWQTPETALALSNAMVAPNEGDGHPQSPLFAIFAAEGETPSGAQGTATRERLPATNILSLVASRPDILAIGLADLGRENGIVRRFDSDPGYAHEPLAIAASRLVLHKVIPPGIRWIHYYGPPGTLPGVTLKTSASGELQWPAAESLPVADRVVFVGQAPGSGPDARSADQFRTPLARTLSGASTGVEIHATVFENLARNGAIREWPRGGEWMLVLALSVLAGLLFPRWTPLRSCVMAAVGALLIACAAVLVFRQTALLLPWPVLAGPMMLAAAGTSLLPLKSAFISYRRVDGLNVAQSIATELRAAGVETFLDLRDHSSGSLQAVLFPEIARRHNLLLILTPAVVKRWRPDGDWIGQELTVARQLGRPVLPVFVDGFEAFLEGELTSRNSPLPAELDRVIREGKRAVFQSNLTGESATALVRRLHRGVRRARPSWKPKPTAAPLLAMEPRTESTPPVR